MHCFQSAICALAFTAVLCFASPSRGEETANAVKTQITALATYAVPKGWDLEEGTDAADPILYLRKGLYAIKIRLLGGKNTRWPSPKDYLSLPGTTIGRPPEKRKRIRVAGSETWLYERGFPINLGDPHEPGSGNVDLGKEQYCIVPVGEKYFVLSRSYEDVLPDPDTTADSEWNDFLHSFKLKR